MIKIKNNKGSLIKSYSNHSQSYIYDQALAIIAFSSAHDKNSARKLLQGLSHLLLTDGSLYFSYNLDGTSPYPQEGDLRISGAIAWVALAATHYQKNFYSTEFKVFNQKILHYLSSQIMPIDHKNETLHAVRFAPNDFKSTLFNETEVLALEHNLDAYVAFNEFGKVNQSLEWKDKADHLYNFIMHLWDSRNAHFWPGMNLKTKEISKSELYLDNQTWSLLALDEKTLSRLDPESALELNCEVFLKNENNLFGFMDSKPANRPSPHSFIWSEGTIGHLMAMKKIEKINNKEILCEKKSAEYFIETVKKMKQSDGGIAYSTATHHPDFSNASSVAGTAWLYFAMKKINPFEIN